MRASLIFALPDLGLIPPTCAYIIAGAFGAIVGSFLNVVIHRVPQEESIVFPHSRCPSCGNAIAFYDNIPILSYLVLRGKCRSCKAHISARYPAVELLTALLFVAVTWHDGLTVALPFDLVFAAALLALVFIDAEHMILPNKITYPGILFAAIARVAIPYLTGAPHFDDMGSLMTVTPASLPTWSISLVGAFLGALLGGGSLWVMGWVWEKLRKEEAMGLGDVKMMFMVGAYLGWRLTILTIFLGVLSGSMVGILLMMWERQLNMKKKLPFGIFLSIGAIIALLAGAHIVEWYAGQYR
jgi:leader peptidase (prepilin peptidase)/N-methyltransferase